MRPLEAPQGFIWADHRIVKAPPVWQAPHHNCSSLSTSTLYLQAQNQMWFFQCDLGIPVQGSNCFTWPGAVLMQSQIAFAVCFKGTLPACGQFAYWDLWEILVKTQGKKVLETWSAWGLLLCVQSLNLSCSATSQYFLAYSFTAHLVAQDCLVVLDVHFHFQLQVSFGFPNTITVCLCSNSESLLCSLLLLPPPQYCPLKMKLSCDLPTFFAD